MYPLSSCSATMVFHYPARLAWGTHCSAEILSIQMLGKVRNKV